MKHNIFFTPLLFLLLAGAAPSPLVSPGMKATNKKQNDIINTAVMKQEMSMASDPKGGSTMSGTSDIMIVDPKQVSSDWKEAFTMLKRRQTGTITFHLASGEKIIGIQDLNAVSGGYLMFFTLKNLHGMQYKIIKTSEIVSLSTE